ncbi:hypothetical protein CIG75_10570 [Tumebacillus algifaecis]|uniref:Response regulatory domain-containing protein n=1 Tax=Tumebacillus algifaecis TaxID=1214604 RepID=A0A223D194_9BACL|nr:hypothetical protein CIG75_10570 [Tumebacillus algifaecis]
MRLAILIADDDPHLRTLVGFYLQKEGYRVLPAEDGAAASRLLEEERVHLAIVDVMMPGYQGDARTIDVTSNRSSRCFGRKFASAK